MAASFPFMNGIKNSIPEEVRLEAIHCVLTIRRPVPGVVVIVLEGSDVGEFGDAPFRELAKDLEPGLPIELFVDARAVPGASVNVSNDWARWMQTNRNQLHRVSLVCKSRFVEMTANFVRRFTEFGDRMRIYTDPKEFDRALDAALALKNRV